MIESGTRYGRIKERDLPGKYRWTGDCQGEEKTGENPFAIGTENAGRMESNGGRSAIFGIVCGFGTPV